MLNGMMIDEQIISAKTEHFYKILSDSTSTAIIEICVENYIIKLKILLNDGDNIDVEKIKELIRTAKISDDYQKSIIMLYMNIYVLFPQSTVTITVLDEDKCGVSIQFN